MWVGMDASLCFGDANSSQQLHGAIERLSPPLSGRRHPAIERAYRVKRALPTQDRIDHLLLNGENGIQASHWVLKYDADMFGAHLAKRFSIFRKHILAQEAHLA